MPMVNSKEGIGYTMLKHFSICLYMEHMFQHPV